MRPCMVGDIPTLKEVGYDVSFESIAHTMGPPKMPKQITETLVKAFAMVANDPEYQKFAISRMALPIYLPPDKAMHRFNEQRRVIRAILEKAGMLKEK